MPKKQILRKNCVDGITYPIDQLIRFAKLQNNEIVFDSNHKKGGRGSYCKNDCQSIEYCFKRKLLNRSFKMNIDIETYNKLREEVTIWQKTQKKESQI